ncbi:hypothetical protein ACQY0O_005122 [Thecaphora frezii]
MDPTFASPPTYTRSLGAELDFSHSYSHSRSASLESADAYDHASTQFSELTGLGSLRNDLASELDHAAAAAELDDYHHHHLDLDHHFDHLRDELHHDDHDELDAHQHIYGRSLAQHQQRQHGDRSDSDDNHDQGRDDDDVGYRTPPRRGTRRKAATPKALGGLAGGSLAAELGPATPQRSLEASPHSSPLHTPNLDRYTANVSEMEESLRTTREFLDRLKGVGSSTSAAPFGGLGEDTTHIEQSAAKLVRSLYDFANERETQIRELRDMLRIFGRNEAEWVAALAEVDALPDDDDDGDGDGDQDGIGGGADGYSYGGRARRVDDENEDFLGFATPLRPRASYSRAALLHDDDDDDDEDRGPRFGLGVSSTFLSSSSSSAFAALREGEGEAEGEASGGAPSARSPLATHLTHLQTTTQGLIASLTTIHEHSQVSKSAMNDAARRLRSLKTVMAQWRAEVDGVERSREWIEREEKLKSSQAQAQPQAQAQGAAQRATTTTSAGTTATVTTENVREWTRAQMMRFEKVLEEAEQKAKVLLTPVPFQGVAA